MDNFKEKQIVIPTDNRPDATVLASIINHPKDDVWAQVVCRGSRWTVVIHQPIPSSGEESQ